MTRDLRVFLLAILFCTLAVAACRDRPPVDPKTGRWHAWLDSPGGDLPFGLELLGEPGRPQAYLVNGIERAPVTQFEWSDAELTLRIEHYDSTVTARLSEDGRRLDGRWEKTSGPGERARLEFHAVKESRPRFPDSEVELDPRTVARIAGRWAVDFAEDDHPAVGIFRAGSDGRVTGTFLTTTGDYRYLEGTFDGERLRLSCFDGAHAFLFDARLEEDGTLAGDFWSRDSWHETWTASKDPDAALPDAFELTRWIDGSDLSQVEFPDLEGRPRSLADPEFGGRARMLVVFGSWCPNCNDATAFLVELDREYRDRGLSILGLAFEATGDLERDIGQVRRYADHHGIRYPVLVAGMSDKTEASKAFPLLDRIRSYPTTIFMHGDGRVRAVHQGYSGPATGDSNRKLRERFVDLIEELLAGPGA